MEARRKGFFFTGAIIALGLSLLAFKWKTGDLVGEQMVIHEEMEDELPPEDAPEPIRVYNPPVFVEKQKGDVKEVDSVVKVVEFIEDTSKNDFVFDPTLPLDTIPQEITVFVIEKTPEGPVPFVDRKPEYPGGQTALLQLMRDNIIYPEMAKEMRQSDRMFVQFVVEKDGTPTNFKVIAGKYKSLNREAIRVAKLMENWKPAELNGKKVATYFKLPFVFTAK